MQQIQAQNKMFRIKMLKKQNDMQGLSLLTADAFPVVASLPPKIRLLLAG